MTEQPKLRPTDPGYRPPELPASGAGLAHIVIPATVVAFVGFVVLLFMIDTLRENDAMVWLWSFLTAGLLGLVGLGIYSWQRAAARRGTRGSQTMALDESL